MQPNPSMHGTSSMLTRVKCPILPQSLGSLHPPPFKVVGILINVAPLDPSIKGVLVSEETLLPHSNMVRIPFVMGLDFSST